MQLIIINGLPGTGKTTIAKPLAVKMALPLLAKDTIKEFLFDTLGVGDREWSKILGKASSEFMYNLVDGMLANNRSVIIESAFELAFVKPHIQKYIDAYDPEIIEIYLSTDRTIRRKRFIDRNESGDRHNGHADEASYLSENDVEPLDKYAPIGLGRLISIDTSVEQIDIDLLLAQLHKN